MTLLTERGFDAKVEHGWSDRGDGNFSIIEDSTAPFSPKNVGQARFTPSLCFGCGPIQTVARWDTSGVYPRTLYVAFWIKLSQNWVGNASGVNKVFHIYVAGGNRVVLNVNGIGLGPLKAEVRLQGMGVPHPTNGVSWNAYPNVNAGAATIHRGQWAFFEVVLVANTPGMLDGQIHFWLDRVKVGDYAAGFGPSSAAEIGAQNAWSGINWNPTYGGGGPGVPVDQFMWLDHVYVSGKN